MKNIAKKTAEKLLENFGCRSFPVDPVWIANQLGIKVLEAKLPKNVSGALVKKQGVDPVIIINETDSRSRKRFTCAHELGHYIKRNLKIEDSKEYEYIDLRGNLASQGTDEDERFANEFAACLLMPEKAVKDYYDDGSTSVILAQQFDVSDDAMNFRLLNCAI
jgi:Zn-dependent peptidase ImmA (M78 family)